MLVALSLFLLTAPASAEPADEAARSTQETTTSESVDQARGKSTHEVNRQGVLRRMLTQRAADSSSVRTARQSAKRSIQETSGTRRDLNETPGDDPRADGPSP